MCKEYTARQKLQKAIKSNNHAIAGLNDLLISFN